MSVVDKHLGEPWRAFPKTSGCLDENMTVFLFKRGRIFSWGILEVGRLVDWSVIYSCLFIIYYFNLFIYIIIIYINKNYFLYCSIGMDFSNWPTDQLTINSCHCLFLKKVDSILTLKINNSISVRNQLTSLPAEVDLFSWNGWPLS